MTQMRTLLFRMAEQEDGWQISLHLDDSKEWLSDPVATELVPRELPPAPVPVPAGSNGADAIRTLLLSQSEESGDFERIGAYLHGLLRRGSIGERWDAVAAAEPHKPLRVLLDVPESLASLPWELMCSGTHWLATDVTAPLSRVGSSFPGAGELLPVRWPLRVLVVIGSQEHDRIVEAEEEIAKLNDAFRRMCGQVDVEFLHQPSRPQVRDMFRALRPHIFHFIGHGGVEGQRGRLILHDPGSGDDVPWTTAEILSDLRGWQPRVAILNACRSTSVEEQQGAWRVADAFAVLGVPAVIAMQADIRGDAAALFTGELYTALAEREPLDVAVTRGRLAISDRTGLERRDYALPSLTLSVPPETVLRMRFAVSEEYRKHLERVHRNFPAFVDRTRERRRLWREVDPAPDEPDHRFEPADVIAIVGGKQVGKSELARWCVGACELHGGNAAYVDLSRGNRLECLSALGIIAETLADSAVHGTANRRALDPWSEFANAFDRADPSNGGPRPADDALSNAIVSFRDALKDASGGRPLLIAIDDVGALPDEQLELLCDLLLEPIALHDLAPVRVILVLSEDDSDRITGDLQRAMGNPIVLTSFKPEEFRDIAGQYLRYHFQVPTKDVDEALEPLKVRTEFRWPHVTALETLIESFGWERYP